MLSSFPVSGGFSMRYEHEIDALNALIDAVERNNALLEQLLVKDEETKKKHLKRGNET